MRREKRSELPHDVTRKTGVGWGCLERKRGRKLTGAWDEKRMGVVWDFWNIVEASKFLLSVGMNQTANSGV